MATLLGHDPTAAVSRFQSWDSRFQKTEPSARLTPPFTTNNHSLILILSREIYELFERSL